MDPKENIKEQRKLANEIFDVADDWDMTPFQVAELVHKANRLAELVLALDEWRRKGGFDPYAP